MSDEMEPLSVEARLIADLSAQVTRLTQQVAFRDMLIRELKHEIETERAAVVAYLREEGHAWVNAEVVMLADFIERGDHRREEEP
jgi:hypothetical protein